MISVSYENPAIVGGMISVSYENPVICVGYDAIVVVVDGDYVGFVTIPVGMDPAIPRSMNTTESMVREIVKVCLARGYSKQRVLKMVAVAAVEVGRELGLSTEETKAIGWKVANELNAVAVSS